MSHAHVELYLLQGLYVPCPCGTLFITGVICPMPMLDFIYYRGYMSHAHVELYLLQGLYVPCPCGTLFIAGVIAFPRYWGYLIPPIELDLLKVTKFQQALCLFFSWLWLLKIFLCFLDILFGLPWQKTGISRYFIRNKQRTISFAVTIVLKKYDQR